MESSPSLQVGLDDGLLTLTLNRPQRHNALDEELKSALAGSVARAGSDGAVRAVLLRGAGRSFCAGGDVRRIEATEGNRADGAGSARARSMLQTARQLMIPLLRLDKPVVAAVHGHVIGAGVGLALAADIVIAADDARFGFPFVEYALPPDLLTGYLLPRWVGPSHARVLLLRPRVIEAGEALAIGLVSDVVPSSDLEEAACALARDLAYGPTLAYARARQQVDAATTLDLDAFAELEARHHGECVDSTDYAEMMRARIEQRRPVYEGH